MYPSLLLSAALLRAAAPIPRDTVPNTSGPAPRVLALKADANGNVRVIGTIPVKMTVTNIYFVVENNKQVQKRVEQEIVTSRYVNKTLADCNGTFTAADGTLLNLEEATGRVKNGATVLVSSDGKPIAKRWLRATSPDTVVMVADGFSHVQPQWGSNLLPETPAPRLTMLGSDARGKVVAPCTSAPIDGGGMYADVFIGNRILARGGRIRNYAYSSNQPSNATVVLKPLTDVKFDAYDLGGKLIARGEVLKRLAAGGMVLVAGDDRMPDPNYLKGFRGDLLVLVGPELVLPVPPIDETKKKNAANNGAVRPAVPAIIIRGRVGGAAIVPAAPVAPRPKPRPVKEAAKPAEKK